MYRQATFLSDRKSLLLSRGYLLDLGAGIKQKVGRVSLGGEELMDLQETGAGNREGYSRCCVIELG